MHLLGGLTIFAILALILDAFKIGYFAGYSECSSPTEAVYPAAHALHTLAQLFFVWFHASDVIQSFMTFERFGSIHAVCTNLLLWANGVLMESEHDLREYKRKLVVTGMENMTLANPEIVANRYTHCEHLVRLRKAIGDEEPLCNCSTGTCSLFSSGSYYLYPFYVEYHIFISAMLYIMWRNIGKVKMDHKEPVIKMNFLQSTTSLVVGLITLAVTIIVVATYISETRDYKNTVGLAVTTVYSFSIVVMIIICVVSSAGLFIYRINVKSSDDSEDINKKLDASLLVASSSGPWLLSWCSVLALISISGDHPFSWLNLIYAIMSAVEKYVQNLFLIESEYRQHHTMAEKNDISIDSASNRKMSTAPPDQEKSEQTLGSSAEDLSAKSLDHLKIVDTEMENVNNQQFSTHIPVNDNNIPVPNKKPRKVDMHRAILKNIAMYLFFANVSLWLLPAFGCRPEYDDNLEEMIFGFENWVTIVNIAMPFIIFYRMHAAVLLFEIYFHL
ncbi:proton channel OTOP1-like [Protopterus annectens]|uniref:proton channel OTOP1-like n=1 Tax=Protopterus annectens TaxID=7888 RepID=UPI001CF9B3C4|nr:proton channel OTOP1-like [Protopterus annectens]